jgi:DNA repair exonuclease SbcCD ATPase subunit
LSSIQFSLHDYVYAHRGIGLDTLFIDEVLDTLDQVGVANIIELLNLKMKYCRLDRLFIVTHNQELARYFDGKLVVEKDIRGLTKVVK